MAEKPESNAERGRLNTAVADNTEHASNAKPEKSMLEIGYSSARPAEEHSTTAAARVPELELTGMNQDSVR